MSLPSTPSMNRLQPLLSLLPSSPHMLLSTLFQPLNLYSLFLSFTYEKISSLCMILSESQSRCTSFKKSLSWYTQPTFKHLIYRLSEVWRILQYSIYTKPQKIIWSCLPGDEFLRQLTRIYIDLTDVQKKMFFTPLRTLFYVYISCYNLN